jgi:hypothetical protein
VPLALRTAVFANCDAADAWLAKNDPEENLPQRRLGVGSSIKKAEQLLMEPERKSSPRNCCCETVAAVTKRRMSRIAKGLWTRCSRTSARAR